jgi:hypothetical protein
VFPAIVIHAFALTFTAEEFNTLRGALYLLVRPG